MFEYQTAISELTGLPVSNASVYEGPSAVGAAGYLAKLRERPPARARLARRAPALARDARHARARLRADGRGAAAARRRDRPRGVDGGVRRRRLRGRAPAAELPRRRRGRRGAHARRRSASARSSSAPATRSRSACCEPPGAQGVDIAVGEGQTLGNRLDFGGPSFGFFAASQEHLRRMPGRIAGETVDVDGKRGFVLTLQTREQHIRREKATSNICTAQALNALAGVVYLGWLGRRGLVELGELLLQRTAYARETLCAIDGVEPLHEQPVVREFAVRLPSADVERGGRAAARRRGSTRAIGSAAPIRSTRTGCSWRSPSGARGREIDRLAEALGGRGRRRARRGAGRGGGGMSVDARRSAIAAADDTLDDLRALAARAAARSSRPRSTCPSGRSTSCCPAALRRTTPARLPEVVRARAGAPLQPPLEAQLRPRHRLLPARLVHDEAQPEAARARRGAAGQRAPASAAGPEARAGRARADVEPAGGARRDRRPAARLAAAERRLARRAGRRAAHARLPRGPRRAPHEGADARHRARHEPGDGDDGRLRGREGRHERRRRRRRRRPAREGGRAGRLPDADEPDDARPVRPEHRRDRARSCTAWGRRSTTTARTSTRSWASRAPATWASTSCTSTCTSRSPSRTAAAGRAPGRSRSASGSSRTCRARRSCAARDGGVRPSTSTTTVRSRSASCAASRATTACSCAPTRTSARSAPRA